MKKHFLIVFSLLFFSIIVYPQKRYSAGYVITNNFDTLRGMVSLKTNYQNRHICNFIEKGSSEPVSLTPDDIRAFRIENSKYYISKEIEIDSVRQKVFLEYLVDGIIDLYYLKTLTDEYFFVEKDNVMTLLSNESHIVTRTEKAHDASQYTTSYMVNSERYKNILRFLFQDSPETLKEIPRTLFAYKPLINIAVDYHNAVCKGQQCINFTKSTRNGIYLEPFVGLISSGMHLQTSKDVANNLFSYAGFRFRFQPVKSFSRWNVITGMNFSKNKFSGDFITRLYMQNNPNDRLTRLYAAYSILRIPVRLERTFTDRRFQPLIFAGITNELLMKLDYSTKDVDSFAHAEPAVIETYMRKYQIGYTAGAGARYILKNRSYLVLQAEFEQRNPLVDSGWILDKHWVNSMLLNIGYGFRIN